MQIDESKIGKTKYHRGHVVEGQWVFGGIEEDSRKCFIVTVEDRSEKTLLSVAYSRMDRTWHYHSERLLKSILQLVQLRVRSQDSKPLGRVCKSRGI